jgi:hypothetical protein
MNVARRQFEIDFNLVRPCLPFGFISDGYRGCFSILHDFANKKPILFADISLKVRESVENNA